MSHDHTAHRPHCSAASQVTYIEHVCRDVGLPVVAVGLAAGPGHCPPDTRLACDVILPPRLSQLESAPCLQQTRASHKPVYCDPCVQHTPAGCSQTLSGAAAPAVISWSSASQGMKPDTRPRKQCLQHFKQLDRAFTILQERRILAFEDFSTDQK